MHFSLKRIGKFYVNMKLVLREEEVEEVNFYSFVVVVVVVVFFAFLFNAVMVEVRGALRRFPIYIAVLLIFKNRLIRYGIIVFYINSLTTNRWQALSFHRRHVFKIKMCDKNWQ